MKPVYFSARAQDDLDSICDYIRKDNPPAATRVREAIINAAGNLASHPELGPALIRPKARHRGVRMLLVREHANYLLIYRVEAQRVLVLRTLHAARDWTRFFR
jgi:addiction module RelE/StbE family toxin